MSLTLGRTALKRTIVVAAVALLTAAGCTPSPSEKPVASPGVEPSGTVEFWHFFTDREAKAIDTVIADFKAKYPKVNVVVKSGQDDTKMLQAIGAGQGPDVGLSYSTDAAGQLCNSSAWIDLKQYVDRDKVDVNKFPETVRNYTEFKGKRCAMPFLADTYGLYYNKTLLAEAGLSGPPKTLTELSDMAKKLTKRKADGTIERAGFLPLSSFYENVPSHLYPMVGAKWLNDDGKSAVGSDPAWKELLKWQKDLVDWYGYDKLEKFRASLGDEWSADNAFHKGQVAMMVDGEFRIAYLRDQAKDVQFGTAPLPMSDSQSSRYGAGYVTGNIMGVSRTAKNPEAAWALVRYLSTDTGAIVKLANLIKNVPTTTEALANPGDLATDPEFKVFIDMFQNPNSVHMPSTAIGPALEETMSKFMQKWQSGSATDLDAGLKGVDEEINKQLQLAG
ncbi:ABC transporter substrate-binding protein [Micromonospora globispora]|uniref:ABC transporter substrate-binding protein n=1 Tax=Micromonospora globispora TaxID=1450148 RepID=A0A317JZY6_9ACTN|nr:ABC transporter substrate-binding protein [Micromonospora globispora]PWU46316.1 ABC transporter substrate-binding protein [Micromonospora globispora]PWU59012.1 ABC transporter substrate-binding protein [Micromonospora globispora]